MLDIKDKKDCCGCEACVQRCPKSCITMREDNEGFLYPEIDKDICIDCGLCEKVCPVINQAEERKPLAVYAAKHRDEQIRMASSSGGVFTAIAECVIDEGGVVFGARFNQDWDVVHSYTETKGGLAAFRRSKYVQSRIGESYKEAESFLKSGRKVLFAGTPCQVAGLKCFLRKEYVNLLTVDFICHGVPSPGVWKQYLKKEIARQCDRENTVSSHSTHEKNVRIESISFRDKRFGWKKYNFVLTFSTTSGEGRKKSVLFSEPLNKNIFLQGFLSNLYLRPSCHSCPVRGFRSQSDMTIGDFWGVQKVLPEFDDDKGISVMLVHSNMIPDLDLDKIQVASYRQYCIEKSCRRSFLRRIFFSNWQNSNLLNRIRLLALVRRIKYYLILFLSSVLYKLGLASFIRRVKK